MNVLSIQSQVARGHVGNAAAAFALQRLGIDAWPVPTVILSHHPGHAAAPEKLAAPSPVRPMVAGLARLNALSRCDAVLSGYTVSLAQIGEIADAVDRVKAANPNALYFCDPVLGNDAKGFFLDPALADAYRDLLLPRADILLPNRFELAALTGEDPETADEASLSARPLLAAGPRCVVVKGLRDGGRIGAIAAGRDSGWQVWTPYVEDAADHGTGDLFSALFAAHFLADGDAARALSAAASSVHAIVAATKAAGADELCLVDEQAALRDPAPAFSAVPLTLR